MVRAAAVPGGDAPGCGGRPVLGACVGNGHRPSLAHAKIQSCAPRPSAHTTRTRSCLMPPSVRDWVDPESLPAFISDLVDDLDLTPFLAAHDEPRGMPPVSPRDDAQGPAVRLCGRGAQLAQARGPAARATSASCTSRGNARPGHKAIGEFRRRHLEAFEALFLDILHLCQAAGLVRLGRVALDGTKVKANASKHKAMSYARMDEREAALAAEVKRILEEAEAIDAAEDAEYGDARGDELPAALRTREGRLRAIREARAALEEEARERSGDPEAVPEPRAQRNFTDPESRIMPSRPDGWVQGYNAQAPSSTTAPPGHRGHEHRRPSTTDTALAARRSPTRSRPTPADAPDELLADAGYQSDDNLEHLAATGHRRLCGGPPRQALRRHRPAAPRGRIPTATLSPRPHGPQADHEGGPDRVREAQDHRWSRSSARSRRPPASAASACGAGPRSPASGTSSVPSTTSPSCSAVAGPGGSCPAGTAPKVRLGPRRPSDGPDGDRSSACPAPGWVLGSPIWRSRPRQTPARRRLPAQAPR